MTIQFTAKTTILNGHPVVASKTERQQLAIMIKNRLGLIE